MAQNDPNGAHFEISIENATRSHRDIKSSAIDAAKMLKEKVPGLKVVVRDIRDNSTTEIGWGDGKTFVVTHAQASQRQ